MHSHIPAPAATELPLACQESTGTAVEIIKRTCYHDTRSIISFDPKYANHQGHEEHHTDGLLSSRPTGGEKNLLICGPWLTQLHVYDNEGNKYE